MSSIPGRVKTQTTKIDIRSFPGSCKVVKGTVICEASTVCDIQAISLSSDQANLVNKYVH